MSSQDTGQGQFLAALLSYYHQYRTAYLNWVGEELSTMDAIAHYQRGWLAWYEARLQPEDPYTDDPFDFVKVAAAHYAGWEVAIPSGMQSLASVLVQDPIHYLPPALRLNELQLQLFRQLQELGPSCKELLLLAHYHRLSERRLGEVLGLGGEAAVKRRQCMLMLRERWKQTGLLDPVKSVSAKEHELIDLYFQGTLDVESRWEVEVQRSSDVQFRDAFLLREEWEDCILLAGRQDLMDTLSREESKYQQKVSSPKTTYVPPVIRLPFPREATPYVLIVLAATFIWLALQTFGPSKEQKIFKAFFSELPPPVRTNDQMGRDLAQMLTPYTQGNYLLAYDELLPAANAYPAAPLYLGICALSLNQPQRALDWFDQYLLGDVYKPYAEWYSALAYLQLKQKAAAIGVLADITGKSGHPYEKKAADLLEALE